MNSCCVLLQPHPKTVTSRINCKCGHRWEFKTEWVTDSSGEPIRVLHRYSWESGSHSPRCDGCMDRSLIMLPMWKGPEQERLTVCDTTPSGRSL